MKAAGFLAVLLMAPGALAQDSRDQIVSFSDTTSLAGNTELSRRLLTPLMVVEMQKALAGSGQKLREQPLTLANEKFLVHLPPAMPANGYGLMVFVPPWKEARLPSHWASVLDEQGMIFVSAAASGNDQYDLSRRMPLAVTAAINIQHRYKIDPARIFLAGMSGGSRVAMRLALGYPDLFRGALLNAGSDPPGGKLASLPPRDLFFKFQETSRLVYVTGEMDQANLDSDRRSIGAMRDLCVFNLDSITARGLGHETADPASLSHALDMLQAPVKPDAGKLAACRAAVEKDLTEHLDRLEALIGQGKKEEARTLLVETDQRFAGLAAPRSLELAGRLEKVP